MVIKAAIIAAMAGAVRGMINDGCHMQGTGQVIGKIYGTAATSAPVPTSSPTYATGNSSSSCGCANHLPMFLSDGPMAGGYPWGGYTANNTNPLGGHMCPDTGVTRSFEWYIRRAVGSPDGVQKDLILMNDQFPGPAIEANWGDWIEVTVKNEITGPDEGTAIHWHGFLQTGTPEADGVPGVTQCPIAPGDSYTYRFRASLVGTSWWHSHYSAQYSAGAFGPMIVYGPSQVEYDIDVGVILLTDHYHKDYFTIVEQVTEVVPLVGGVPNVTAIIPVSDNNLINGMNNYDCSRITDGTPCTPDAPLAQFEFTPGKIHRLRLVNAGSDGVQKFSIDGHEMLIIANDFTQIVPYTTKIVTLAVGQRTDVLVQGLADGKGTYWMRSNLTSCSIAAAPLVKAVIHYDSSNALPTTSPWPDTSDPCATDDLAGIEPWFPITPSEPATTVTITVSATINSTGHFVWTMNGSSFRANYNFPTLLLSNAGNNSYPFDPQWNVYNFGSNSSIRFVVINQSPAAHPMHLHGHTPFILNAGVGTWDGSTIINPHNPQRRDTQQLLVGGFIVLQIDADNPGVWPFHCHISWHVSGGLYINVMERPDDIKNLKFAPDVAQTCRDWATFTGAEVPDQIDSGE